MHRKVYVIPVCVLIMLMSVYSVSSAAAYTSDTAGTHALALSSGTASYENIIVTKTGSPSDQSDNYDWLGTNAAVHASGGAKLTITGSSTTIDSNAKYGNAVFSYGGNLSGSNSGDGTTITISDAAITTQSNNSGGIMVTGDGVINATNLTITTSGGSSAAIRSDKGGGTITVSGGTYTTSGTGSPAIYSTAKITGSDVTLKSNAAQVVVIEGGNSVTLTNSALTANHSTLNGQDTTYQAILIYQSQSGDASDGASTFKMTGGTITNTKGDIFHVTNTTTTITLSGVTITNNDSSGYLLRASSDSWGSSGSNGGKVTMNTTGQTLAGNILVDSASTLTMSLSGKSAFTGAINTSGQNGTVKVTVASGSTWTLTANSYVSTLSNKGTINTGSYTLYVNGKAYTGGKSSGTAPSITTASLKNAAVGKSYSVLLKATGTKTITWSADSLPDGLSLTTSGKLSGKPTASGTYSITFTAANSVGSADSTLSLTVADVAPRIKASIKGGTLDTYYTLPFSTSAGTGTITWELSGSLPEGLSFDASTAVLGGVPSEVWNDYVTVTASNSAGEASKKFKLVIKAVKPAFKTKSLAAGTISSDYAASFDITGSKPLTLTLTGLPDGLTFDSDSAKISGTPTEYGSFTVKLTAQNAGGKLTRAYKLNIYAPPVISDITLADAVAGKNYKATFRASGTKTIKWSVSDGSLPAGMSLITTGLLRGKPTSDGEYTFTVQAANNYGTDTKTLSLTVDPVAPKLSGTFRKGTAGKSWSSILKATGTAPLTWTFDESTLPDGISCTASASHSITFSGTTEKSFSGNFTVTVSNNGGTDSKTFALEFKAVAPKITTTSLASGTQGTEYSASLTAAGTPDITWSWSNNPSGLTLDSSTGAISGTPTEAGTFRVKVTAANDAKSVSKVLRLVIAEAADGTLPEEYYSSTEELPEGFVIVAELPEVSADESGLRDFAVTLSDDAPAGAKLYWVANSETPSEDDAAAEFSGSDGKEIEAVPEDRKITVSAWLNKGVIYRPVIAVPRIN
ncbi:MAG: putative Ig domain-containing protein [Synergistaceae bacterium]|nr:putative Ig domain-containing protein [Synergistaceae bacterium]